MKNTAARVGPIGGAGGRSLAHRDRRRAVRPEHDGPQAPGPPARTKNVAPEAGDRGPGAGGKPREAASGGKPLQRGRGGGGASRKKTPRSGHLCAERSESDAGASPPARRSLPAQEPDKGNRARGPEKGSRPNDESVTPDKGGQRDAATSRTYESGGTRNRRNRRSEDRGAAATARPER